MFCPHSRVCYKNSQKVTQHKIALVELRVAIVELREKKVHLVDMGSNFQFFFSFSLSSILSIAFIRMIHSCTLFYSGITLLKTLSLLRNICEFKPERVTI